jgi:hypothetical protein
VGAYGCLQVGVLSASQDHFVKLPLLYDRKGQFDKQNRENDCRGGGNGRKEVHRFFMESWFREEYRIAEVSA